MREFLAKTSLIAAEVQCRPDFQLENLSVGMGPVCWTSLPTGLSELGAGLHFPCAERFPIGKNLSKAARLTVSLIDRDLSLNAKQLKFTRMQLTLKLYPFILLDCPQGKPTSFKNLPRKYIRLNTVQRKHKLSYSNYNKEISVFTLIIKKSNKVGVRKNIILTC